MNNPKYNGINCRFKELKKSKYLFELFAYEKILKNNLVLPNNELKKLKRYSEGKNTNQNKLTEYEIQKAKQLLDIYKL
jgi:hypothetical protein